MIISKANCFEQNVSLLKFSVWCQGLLLPSTCPSFSLCWTRDTWLVTDDLQCMDTNTALAHCDDFHALISQITNTSRGQLIFLIASARLLAELGNKTLGTQWPGQGVMWRGAGAGERWRGGVIMIDIPAGDTTASWHLRWREITQKIRPRAEQQMKTILNWTQKTFYKYLISDRASQVCILGHQWTVTRGELSGTGCLCCGVPLLCAEWSIGAGPVVVAMPGLGRSRRQSRSFLCKWFSW